MAINGVQEIMFGVEDMAAATRFLDDFGLVPGRREAGEVVYDLPEGSRVILRADDDPSLPARYSAGSGVRRVTWGVDTADALEGIAAELARDRQVDRHADGGITSVDDFGLAIGFRVFDRREPVGEREILNSPGIFPRRNAHRTWYDRATPQLIQHVVFGTPDIEGMALFYRDRLKFRITDVSRDRGIFLRADGRNDHHNLFLARTEQPRFLHVSFAVQNIDEMMIGANHMQRAGWPSRSGLGRHRISSMLYFYIPSPLGGEAEYSADGDWLDDDWQPGIYERYYGNHYWVADVPEMLWTAPAPDKRPLRDERPDLARIVR